MLTVMTNRNNFALESAVRASGGISGQAIYDRVLRLLAERCADEAPVIADIGAGVGNFTRLLVGLRLPRPKRVVALDYMPRPATLPPDLCEWLEGDLNAAFVLPAASLDIACALEVIEHLENPRHFCREVFRSLRPGGIAVLTTPNNLSIRAKVSLVLRGYYPAFGAGNYPAHISPILQIDMVRMLQEVGFCNVEISYTDSGDVPGTRGLKWQAVLPGCQGMHFSDNFIACARKPL
jgi:SAM-dependent methyltransferase